jgi:hypothetical protein
MTRLLIALSPGIFVAEDRNYPTSARWWQARTQPAPASGSRQARAVRRTAANSPSEAAKGAETESITQSAELYEYSNKGKASLEKEGF